MFRTFSHDRAEDLNTFLVTERGRIKKLGRANVFSNYLIFWPFSDKTPQVRLPLLFVVHHKVSGSSISKTV